MSAFIDFNYIFYSLLIAYVIFRLALAFETAVNEVLTASFKLAVFYGMWTWLIHTVFQMNIVYIPSGIVYIQSVKKSPLITF